MTDRPEREDEKREDGRNLARTAVLSVLLHVLLVVALWRLVGAPEAPPENAKNEPIWVNLSQQAAPRGHVVDTPRTANNQPPPAASHVSRQSNTVPKETRRANLPVNPVGAPPSRSGGRHTETDRNRNAPVPHDAIPHPYDRLPPVTATDLLNQSSFGDFITSATSSGTYNPPVADAGEAVWLNTHEHKYVGYFMHLKEKIESSWRMTRPPYDREHSGVLQMSILADGTLANASLVQTCGDRELDLAVLRAIRNAAPFNPLPTVWGQEELTVNFGFHYLISQRASIF